VRFRDLFRGYLGLLLFFGVILSLFRVGLGFAWAKFQITFSGIYLELF